MGDRISESLAQSKYVSRAVLLALDGVVDADGNLDTNRTEVYVPNEFVAEMAARHTNLLFGASVNPYRRDALARLEWAKAHGAVLVKWIPPIMDIDPADPRLIPFYKKMAELKLPLLSHTGKEKSFSRADEELGDPEKLRLPLSLGVTVVAAHIASSEKYHGERGPDRLARLMREYPNLYTDISALTQINRPGSLKEALTRPEFSGRLVYGTDFPLINTRAGFAVVFVSPVAPAEIFHRADKKSVGPGCFDEARSGRADGNFRAVRENVWRDKLNSQG